MQLLEITLRSSKMRTLRSSKMLPSRSQKLAAVRPGQPLRSQKLAAVRPGQPQLTLKSTRECLPGQLMNAVTR